MTILVLLLKAVEISEATGPTVLLVPGWHAAHHIRQGQHSVEHPLQMPMGQSQLVDLLF